MTKDLSTLAIKTKSRIATVNPKEIFKSLTLRGTIQNIWEPQAEALGTWFDKHREDSDVVIQMSTGGGKTLVGLLIAQSIVNETKGKVVYVCPTNQLVEQVASKAAECGITVATYMRGQWTNQHHLEAAGFEVEESFERGPYAPEVEHQSQRAYVLSRKSSLSSLRRN